MNKNIIFFLPLLLASCVSASKHEELQRRYDSLETAAGGLDRTIGRLSADTSALNTDIRMSAAKADSLRAMLDDARQRIALLNTSLDKLASSSVEETRRYLDSLQSLQAKLRTREQRMNEIESQLNRRDSIVSALRSSIQNALLGFKEGELSVNVRDGKVYVSLSNQLLFATGSTAINKKGKEALSNLATALNRTSDINILIEGHTDNVPVVNLGQIKDNWDLSVMRATEVTRYLTAEGKVDPARITASGRGEFFPVATGNAPESRAQNRRTEIILTPKLDALYNLLNQQ